MTCNTLDWPRGRAIASNIQHLMTHSANMNIIDKVDMNEVNVNWTNVNHSN